MTQKEEKEYSKLLPRFKEVCCSRLCLHWPNCKELDNDNMFLQCPWFFNYRMFGWPIQKLCYGNFNAPQLPDLREEDVDTERMKELFEYKG